MNRVLLGRFELCASPGCRRRGSCDRVAFGRDKKVSDCHAVAGEHDFLFPADNRALPDLWRILHADAEYKGEMASGIGRRSGRRHPVSFEQPGECSVCLARRIEQQDLWQSGFGAGLYDRALFCVVDFIVRRASGLRVSESSDLFGGKTG